MAYPRIYMYDRYSYVFFSRSFTAANQIYADYYDVDLIVIDWSALAMDVGAVAITPLFAWIFFRQAAGFRIMSITAASCLLISTLVLLLSIQFPVLYPVMALSSLLQGVSYIVGYTVGPSFAVSELPGRNLRLVLGAIVFVFCNGHSCFAMLAATSTC